MKTMRVGLGGLAAVGLLVAAMGATGCSVGDSDAKTWREGERADARAEEAVPVEVAALERGEIEAVLRLSSNLEAEREVQVFAEAPRRVTELLVEEGNTVRKGQLLVRLQDEEQKSAVAKAEIALKQSQRDFERSKELHSQGLVTEQAHNDIAATVERNELALADARRELSYTQVKAPIGGTITERLVNLGDHVKVNQALFRIVDFDSIVARIYVPEKDMVQLRTGQPARLRADALGGTEFRGSIDRISPVVDPGTGTIKVTVATPRQEGLRPGMYVEVQLVTAVHPTALLVPKRALVYDNDQVFLFRMKKDAKAKDGSAAKVTADKGDGKTDGKGDAKAGDKAAAKDAEKPKTADGRRVERLRVTPLLESADFVEPDGSLGLRPGDRVVVAGQSGLKDGGLVRLPGDPEPEKPKKGDDGKKAS